MRWLTLYNKIGKLPVKITNNNNVYALIDYNDGKGYQKVYLTLKHDKIGRPYLVKD